jgi:hypothetical protein
MPSGSAYKLCASEADPQIVRSYASEAGTERIQSSFGTQSDDGGTQFPACLA